MNEEKHTPSEHQHRRPPCSQHFEELCRCEVCVCAQCFQFFLWLVCCCVRLSLYNQTISSRMHEGGDTEIVWYYSLCYFVECMSSSLAMTTTTTTTPINVQKRSKGIILHGSMQHTHVSPWCNFNQHRDYLFGDDWSTSPNDHPTCSIQFARSLVPCSLRIEVRCSFRNVFMFTCFIVDVVVSMLTRALGFCDQISKLLLLLLLLTFSSV